jgi:exodeoxyribonuclease VII small subunit
MSTAADPAASDDLDISYSDAVGELEAILADLEGDNVDVDVLGEQVRRAKELIEHCRGRIDRARVEVEEVVATAGDDATGADDSDSDDDADTEE